MEKDVFGAQVAIQIRRDHSPFSMLDVSSQRSQRLSGAQFGLQQGIIIEAFSRLQRLDLRRRVEAGALGEVAGEVLQFGERVQVDRGLEVGPELPDE